MQTTKQSGTPPSPTATSRAPSVPLSLYREVAAELQATRTNLESLKVENHRLVQHNQQLRLEIERVVQSALQMRQIADHHQPSLSAEDIPGMMDAYTAEAEPEMPSPAAIAPSRKPQPNGQPKASKPPIFDTPSEKLFVEQDSQPRRSPTTEKPSSEVSSWWLILIIGVIVISAFGTGFLIVRPLLPSR